MWCGVRGVRGVVVWLLCGCCGVVRVFVCVLQCVCMCVSVCEARDGNDWTQHMAQGPLHKEDVTVSLLASMRQATEKTEKGGGALTNNVTKKDLWALQRVPDSGKSSLSSTYKRNAEANNKVYDLNQRTVVALDRLAEVHETFRGHVGHRGKGVRCRRHVVRFGGRRGRQVGRCSAAPGPHLGNVG